MAKKKPKTEQQMRRNMLYHAKLMGMESDAKKIFERYDNLLRGCIDPKQRYQIGIMGAAEMHKLLCCPGALIIDGQLIIPQDPNFTPPKE